MTRKELKNCPYVNMQFFLEDYYGIDEELSEKLSILSHKELKKVAEIYGGKLPKISFENLTRDMIYTGEVVLVIDYYGNIAPYINNGIDFIDEFDTTLDEEYISHEIEGVEENDKYKRKRKIK